MRVPAPVTPPPRQVHRLAALPHGAWLAAAAALVTGPGLAASLQLGATAQVALTASSDPAADHGSLLAQGSATAAWLDELGDGWRHKLALAAQAQQAGADCLDRGCPVAGMTLGGTLQFTRSHYTVGRFIAGWSPNLSADTARRSSAFGLDTIAADHCATVLLRECPVARPFALGYEGLTYGALTPALQLRVAGGRPALRGRLEAAVAGGRLWLGGERDTHGLWQSPSGFSLPAGRWRLFGQINRGRTTDGIAHHASLGVSTPWAGSDWQAQWSQQRLSGQPIDAQRKLAVGWRRPLDQHLTPFADLIQVQRDDGQRLYRLDAGLRWAW